MRHERRAWGSNARGQEAISHFLPLGYQPVLRPRGARAGQPHAGTLASRAAPRRHSAPVPVALPAPRGARPCQRGSARPGSCRPRRSPPLPSPARPRLRCASRPPCARLAVSVALPTRDLLHRCSPAASAEGGPAEAERRAGRAGRQQRQAAMF